MAVIEFPAGLLHITWVKVARDLEPIGEPVTHTWVVKRPLTMLDIAERVTYGWEFNSRVNDHFDLQVDVLGPNGNQVTETFSSQYVVANRWGLIEEASSTWFQA